VLKIAFRFDASNIIGTGHLMEIISLIEALREKSKFDAFILTNQNSFTADKLREYDINNIIYLGEYPTEEAEAREIDSILGKINCKHLVLDLLDRSEDYYGYLKRKLTTTCVILDDGEHKEIDASVVVNYSITQDPDFYRGAKKYATQYLIGPPYFFLDDAIIKTRPVTVGPNVERIFINQGGSDPFGLTAKIIRALELDNFGQEFHVVLGGLLQDEHRIELEHLKDDVQGNYKFYSNLPKINMYALMGKSDLAISAAGNTLYELAFLGVPTLVLSHDQRHDVVACAFAQKQAVINLGIGASVSESQIVAALKRFINDEPARMALSNNARSLFNSGMNTSLVEELIRFYSY
jgi:UDP-2,4-diacetamido-2,4,6-trideoxy-beta-L-altropyranose hydrolase